MPKIQLRSITIRILQNGATSYEIPGTHLHFQIKEETYVGFNYIKVWTFNNETNKLELVYQIGEIKK